MPIVLKPHELKLRQQAGEYDEPTCIRGASGVYYGTEEPEDYQINVWVNPEGTVTKTMESPILTGIPTAPTASPHTSTTQIATTEFVMNEVENKIESTDIVDNLTTNDSSKPLSAAQGYSLNNSKVNKTDIADNLTTNDATKVLSAAQGYAIKEELDEKAAAIYDIDSGFTHEDVSAIEIVGNSYAFGTAKYADKKNLIERDTDTTGTSGTVTYQLKRNVVILNGERTGGGNDAYFAEYETDIPAGNYIFKVEPYIGNSTLTNGKNLYIDLWYDNNLSSTYDMRVTLNGVKDVPVSKTFTTTSHVYKIRVWFGFTTNVYDDYRMFYTLFPSDVNIVDTNQTLGPSSTLEVVLPSSMSVVDTMMHSSNAYTIVDTKTYIDNKTPEIDFVYFRPEDYGAVGNGVADDSVALQACINAAQQYSENVGKAIRGFGSYKISTGIVFNCRELDVFLNKIIYTGNDAAVTLSASFSRFMFHSVRAFDGGTNTVCFRVTQTQDSGFTSTYYGNELTCDFARSKGNVLEVTEAQGLTYHSIMYNKVSFRQARSDNANIVNIQAFTFNETDFSCKIPIANNGFLVHYEASASNSVIRVHDSCLETDLANGTNGQVDFIDCRFAEMENLQTSSDRTKGRIFAWDSNRLAAGSIVRATSGIDLVALDVSNARSYEDCLDEVKALYLSGKTTSKAFMSALRYTNIDEFAKIECVARTANANMNENNSMMNIAHGSAIVYYNNLAFKPYNEIYYKVDADMTIELSAENNWSYLTPTVFDINAAEVDINLDASYCCLAINQFDVIQYANKKAIVYDKFGNQIFDGTKYGAGTYRFKCSFVPYEYGEVYIELDNGTHVNCNATLLPSLYSGYNEKWSVIRLDRIGTDADTNYGPDTYVTPEDFGAKGDGTTDDTTAIQAAITEAVSKQVAVRGYKQYKTTSPISVSTNFLDLYLRSVTYTGNNCGISITGSYNNIEFGLLYCASGKAIVMDRPTGKSCAWNKVTAQRIFAHDHAVYFDTHNTNFILYNTFDIRVAKSEIGNCFHGDDFVAENVYMNTTCFCENGWAVYRCAGRFYNLTWEVNVLNGAYLTAGSCYFSGCRYRELVDKMVYYINGQSEYNGGTLIKIVGGDYLILKFVGDDVIPYECIDVTEMTTPESLAEDYAEASTSAEKSAIVSQLARLAFTKVVDAPIRIGNWDTKNGYFVPAKQMFIQSGRKYCIPYHETEYTITEANYDMSDSNFAIDNAKIFPTKMTIGVDSCVIHLSPSYSPVGYSQFIVDQTSHTCTIYDSNNSVTPIFNGSTLGSGVYRLTAYADVSNPTVNTVDPSAHRDQVLFDGSNYTWHIERIDNAGGSSDCGIANVKDFGAVGDGTTDDSTAFQTAVNSCDDLYLESNKTYYLGSEVTVNNSIRIHGGKNTIIKTKTPSGGVVNNGIIAQGTLKLTTTLSSNYVAYGNSGDNIGNKLTLESDSNVAIGDIIVVQATDQYYSYARQYYYLGAAMLITDTDGTSFYVNEGMPFDITKTANLTVKVYSAPKVVFENIRFESDHTSGSSGAYMYPLTIQRCRMPEVRNCSFANANNGLLLRECYGTLVENVTIEKIKEDNTVGYDGYGCAVYGCMNTTFRKVTGQGGQSTIDMSGTITNINTWIKECDLMGECRTGLGMHENAYNTVVEDSIIAGATMYGTVTFNRCTFVENLKLTGTANVSFRGSHNPEWAKIKFKDCVFPKRESVAIVLSVPACQTPIQSFDSVIGRVEIINCEGGRLQYNSSLDQYILSSKVKELIIDGWKDCYDIYHTDPNTIDVCIIRNSTFTHSPWMDKHTTAFWLDGVSVLRRMNDYPQIDRLLVKLARGGRFYLPEDVNISFSSSDTSARYLVCGENIASNNPADYNIGGLSGSAGSALTKTVNTTFSSALSVNSNGNLVLTYPNVTSNVAIYPTCMAYIKERSIIKMTCKLVNSGSTSASSFRACLCIVDAKTGNIVYRSNGQSAEATTAGVVVTHERDVPEDSLVFGYIQCYSGIALSETTFEDFAVKVLPVEFDEGAISFTPYAGSSITGNGTIKSLNGQNNIMADSSSAFAVSFRADLLQRGSQTAIASGASF